MAGRIAYYGNISPQGLVLNLDAAIQGSYPKTGSTWFDISNNGNNGTLTNGPLYTGSNYGAIRFDGVDDYVDTPYTTPIGTSDFSYNTWVNFTSSQLGGIITKRIGPPTYEQFSLSIAGDLGANISGSKIQFGDVQNLSNFRLGITSGSYNDGRWHNITLTRTSTTTTMYIEGAPTVTVISTPLNLSTSTKLFIGVVGNNQSVAGNYLSGSIANAQIYNQALTQFQVWQNFNAYKSRYGIPDIVTDGLVLNLDAGNPYSYLSGSSGTTWTNTVPASSSISGSLINGTTYSNGAMVFDGTNDYVDTANIINDLPSFTVSCWVRTIQSTVGLLITKLVNYSNGAGWGLFHLNGSARFIIQQSGGQWGVYYTSTGLLNNGVWHNITAVITNRFLTGMYIDGTLISTNLEQNNLNTITSYSNSGNVRLGTDQLPEYFYSGSMSNGLLYNRALTQTEITQNFNALRGRYGI